MAKIIWRRSEIEIILSNYDSKTTDELMKLLPGRSRKAINRKLEKLREEGRIGNRSQDTVKRAYRQRVRGSKVSEVGRKRLPVDEYEYESVDENDGDYDYEGVE